MRREESVGGKVGGRAQEWGGVVQVAAHSFQLTAYTSNPHHDSVPYVESSLNLLSPRFFCALVFMLNLYTVTVNVQYYFFFKFHMTAVVHRDSNYSDE